MNARRYVDLIADGMTPAQIAAASKSGVLRRIARGLYLELTRDPSLVDHLRALFLVLPPGCVVAYHTAAELLGFGVLTSSLLHIAQPAGAQLPDIKGVQAHQVALPIGAPVEILGLPCMSAARTAIDLARLCERPDGLAVLDAALRAGAVTREELSREVLRHDGLRGVRQARELLPLADGRAASRPQSHLRLILSEAGLPLPEPQLLVPDNAEPRYQLQLGWRLSRLGAEHDSGARMDRERHNWLSSNGWSVQYFADSDIYGRPAYVADTMRAALS